MTKRVRSNDEPQSNQTGSIGDKLIEILQKSVSSFLVPIFTKVLSVRSATEHTRDKLKLVDWSTSKHNNQPSYIETSQALQSSSLNKVFTGTRDSQNDFQQQFTSFFFPPSERGALHPSLTVPPQETGKTAFFTVIQLLDKFKIDYRKYPMMQIVTSLSELDHVQHSSAIVAHRPKYQVLSSDLYGCKTNQNKLK